MSEVGGLPKPRVAILGTGRMGSAAARRLSALGFPLTLWNRTREKAQALAEEIGATVAGSPVEAVSQAEIAVAYLADDDALFSVLAGIRRMDGLVFVNMGTNTPRAVSNAKNYVTGNGGCYVEAPIVAGPRVLQKGEAVLIVAGEKTCIAQASPLLEGLSSHIVYVGEEPEKAQALKLSFNLLLITTVNSLSEALALAESYGIGKDVVKELLSHTVFRGISEKYVDRATSDPARPASFPLRLAAKDLYYAVSSAFDRGLPLEGVASVMEKYLRAVREGLGEADYTRIYWLNRKEKEPPKQG